jgi:predicted DCC family thiol-disulfide oxidoreductase YuxK
MPGDVEILYDGACPLCRQAVCLWDAQDQPFATIDARADSALRDAATAAGIDLDQGFVVRRNGQLYAGTEAAQVLSGVVGQRGWRNRLTRMFFGTRSRTRHLYPLFRAARRAALALTGKPLIRNLDQTARPE